MCVREDVERGINHGKSQLKTAELELSLGLFILRGSWKACEVLL